MVCETSKDEPYSFPCDIWSSGITLIELAEMNPPYHEMNPMRVLFRIPKADPPSLFERCKWSHNFHSFLELCLNKDPSLRASSEVCSTIYNSLRNKGTRGSSPLLSLSVTSSLID